jgi:hypothetical protein
MRLHRQISRVCGALLLGFAAQVATAENGCSRACLKEKLDAYVSALVAHRPTDAPLAGSVRATENGAAIAVGEGLWRTAGSPGMRRDAFDPESGSAVTQLLLPVDGAPAVVFIRIKVVQLQITEAETIVAENGKLHQGVLSDFDAFAKDAQPEWEEPIPAGKRASRAGLLAVAKTYFTALNSAGSVDFKNALFADDCNRFENGMQVTNTIFMGRPATSCAAQFDGMATMFRKSGGRVKVDHERTVLVDREKGVVAMIGIMTPPQGAPGTPSYTVLIADMFKIVDGKLSRIQITYDAPRGGDGAGW